MNPPLRKAVSGLFLLICGLVSVNVAAAEYHFGVNAETG